MLSVFPWTVATIKVNLCVSFSDVNECDYFNGMCEHFCKNKEGAFYCTCAAGFTLIEGFMCEGITSYIYSHMIEIIVH